MKSAILEIGTEEIPHKIVPSILEQMKIIAEKVLSDERLKYSKIHTYGTPRRLVIYIEDLADRAEPYKEEIIGPGINIAKDENGNFTDVAIKFAERNSLKLDDLQIKKTSKGEYIYAIKTYLGKETEKNLPDIFIRILSSIMFPKTMLWNTSGVSFIRPIRNILSLYGDKTIRFDFAGVKSSKYTFGLYTISDKKIEIKAPEKYLSTLRNNCVICDQELRKEIITKILIQEAKKIKCTLYDIPGLIDEVNFLVEYPVGMLCKFDTKFLALPKEIILSCIKKQKCFPIKTDTGKIANYFIAVRNGISEYRDIVREGYEKVLTARLTDAEFFLKQDTKTKLEQKTEKLKGVVFHEKLGTLYDKIQRMMKLSESILPIWHTTIDMTDLQRCILLCKADLVTEMVKEYPELQGIVGQIYALKDGEKEIVAKGIEEHYWPITAESELPSNDLSSIVSLVDKIDTIAGNFAVGLAPTGSEDPYGLRRAAIGILRIVLENKLELNLADIFRLAIDFQPVKIYKDKTLSAIMSFLQARLETIFAQKGYKQDEIAAVSARGIENVYDTFLRLQAVSKIRQEKEFNSLIIAYKRAANIIKQAEEKNITISSNIVAENLVEQEEKILYETVNTIMQQVEIIMKQKKYFEILKKLMAIKLPIDTFFDKVMVMSDDESARNNRLVLLKSVIELFLQIADFSYIQLNKSHAL